MFNVATRKINITYVACIVFLTDSASLDPDSFPGVVFLDFLPRVLH